MLKICFNPINPHESFEKNKNLRHFFVVVFILYEIEHIVSNTGIKLKQCENRNIIMAKKGKSEVA